jgi:hypothetical protein
VARGGLSAATTASAPAYFVVNAVRDDQGRRVLPLPAAEVVAWAGQRWEVEVCHRELKSGFGVGQMQCWSARATVRTVQLQAWSYAVHVLAGYRAWGDDRQPRRTRTCWWGGPLEPGHALARLPDGISHR